jgi:FkbM family methyltransferase
VSLRSLCKAGLARFTPLPLYLFVNARTAARDIASGRRWAPEISQLPHFVRPGDTVVDVGGGHGLYTYHLSRLVGANGRVHAFEPMPPNLQILRHTVKRHRLENVTIHAAACGDKKQRVHFAIPIEDGVLGMGGARQGASGLSFECDVVRLDDVISGEVNFMKIDVEGAELLVLRGAENILRSFHPAILFEAGDHTEDFGYKQQEVFDHLSALGYRFFSGGFRGKALEPRERFVEAEDYFCVAGEWPRTW